MIKLGDIYEMKYIREDNTAYFHAIGVVTETDYGGDALRKGGIRLDILVNLSSSRSRRIFWTTKNAYLSNRVNKSEKSGTKEILTTYIGTKEKNPEFWL